ncbi:MAG TPA: serine O-acetyltransferase EpsC [Candidatus Cybelea sp.]|nr:serine O-acetyltransferase EpsC [Candidatus Cybelea sp.]
MAMRIFKRIAEEIDATMARDPAARSRAMVVLAYPSFWAVVFHRVAHRIYKAGFYTPARMISQFSRFLTGIEINPGARIGRRLFIDHGMGVVIGETAIVGDDVTLYHDVTLGGISPSINSSSQVDVKRHPTLEDGVIVGAGAQILGDIVVGRNARVGANAVVVKDVPPGVAVVGIPGRVVKPKDACTDFDAYGMPGRELPDPVARAIDGLMDQIRRLQARIAVLESERQNGEPHLNGINGTPEISGGDGNPDSSADAVGLGGYI